MINPTVGRVVWYRTGPEDLAHATGHVSPDPGGQPLAAIIAHVLSDERVNLAVSDVDGRWFGRTGVLLVQDGEVPEGAATWMPFQKGQAAKTETVADRLPAEIAGLRDDVLALHARLIVLEMGPPAPNVATTAEAAAGEPAKSAEPTKQAESTIDPGAAA